MSVSEELRTLSAEILEVESTFGPNGEPPSEEAAAKWLRLVSSFRAAHGLPRGYPGPHRRSFLRLPTDATVQCRFSSGTAEAHCSVMGYGGLGLSLAHTSLAVGTKLEITEAVYLGKRYQLGVSGELRWAQKVGTSVHVGVRFDTDRALSTGGFSAWYLAVYHEYLRALARGEAEPLMGDESARSVDAPNVDAATEVTKARMLVVDDEPENLKVLERAFRNDFEIFTAPNGAAALELALRIKPQVVITDQRMPTATGIELLSSLRRQLPDTVRILVTGYVAYNTLVEAVNLAMVHHYVEKPVQINNLVDAVATLCNKRPG